MATEATALTTVPAPAPLQLRLARQRAAYHDAGHAVTAYALRRPVPPLALPRPGERRRCCGLSATMSIDTPAVAICACIVLLAGLEAELRGCQQRAGTTELAAAAGADIAAARQLLRRFELPNTITSWSRSLLDDHWDAVQQLAGVLHEHRLLSGSRAEAIIGRALRVA